jgi:hypothetical protein
MTYEIQGYADGAATGRVRTILQLEGLMLFAGMVALYAHNGGSWWLFAVLFLAPDLSLAAYVAGPRIGAAIYNALHTTLLPIVLGVGGAALSSPLARQIALIWLAHIGIDRALGYGLKYASGFGFTHLGRIGKKALPQNISASGRTAS